MFASQVYIRRSVHEIIDKITSQEKDAAELPGGNHIPVVRKSKLLIVDLAGSERIDKSGIFSLYLLLDICISNL